MQAIRQIVKRESIKSVFIPEELGENVEIRILPIDKTPKSKSDFEQLMNLQEHSGFARTILADSQEDVWNDL